MNENTVGSSNTFTNNLELNVQAHKKTCKNRGIRESTIHVINPKK